ncbi:DNA-processing protein DprA [Agromyces atrinae]|uniref:DNA-processing protein DprA n=1 Tax=Agromyces atrinae TaxID=592376 RepID=UPI001F569723|nr:DNA-processing protein DprA [Agromyces atrinae]MCI2958142.1 DNA-processing protein DprA [Agromyces atrinae]
MSTISGRHRVTVARLRADAGLRGDEEDVASRLVIQTLIEPGDAVAGAAIAVLGAPTFLDAVLRGEGARALADRLVERGADDGGRLIREFTAGLRRWSPRIDDDAVARSLDQARRMGAVPLVPEDDLWPSGLDALGLHRPVALWARGRHDELGALARSIALVGARAATPYGEHVAVEAAAGLVERGFAVVSGAAYGIDGAAHRAALAREGVTVAVLAGGIDRFYPAGHEALLTRISEVGAVLAEVPCGTAPTKWRFLQRNRMIAAASSATVVVEAGVRSGSLNTAGHAASLSRPLGAVPGPVTSPASAGCHRLFREYDAVCVTSADEMAELVGESSVALDRGPHARSSDEVRVIDSLAVRSARTVTDIARRSGLAPGTVRSVLGHLELGGEVAPEGDGWVRRPTRGR